MKKKKSELNDILKTRLSRFYNAEIWDWGVHDEYGDPKLSAANCRHCGNYLSSETMDKFQGIECTMHWNAIVRIKMII